jgi:N-acetylmuramoyl-L-alanine amidase
MMMDAATLAAICTLHAQQPAVYPSPSPPFSCVVSEGPSVAPRPLQLSALRAVASAPDAREAMARIVIAEAGDQGDSGMAGVVFTILNRLSDGRWGATVEAVVDAPGQFEPVMRAGGSWRDLRPASANQKARVDTIVNLALDGRLPDLTGGARYFQNQQIVAARARAGAVSSSIVNFGGAAPSAVIGAHAFYADRGPSTRGRGRQPRPGSSGKSGASAGEIFVGENRISSPDLGSPVEVASSHSSKSSADGGGMFVP